ncbi:hypothetical protein PAPYR_11599 [Paratrimastix pyriformis]|uniref:Uncharacterized protein n=1 Tax=Paratrimastix pyriformis TaxID=342808 RepID=A0ABQ8UAI7_9EUKA|nr:hypothetical protein PAPYR_12442 [Paratrimastix pyriformis]KAJ4453825.1 hypothetical protein PAPYR_11599 [Paratrimastix pyriformis]
MERVTECLVTKDEREVIAVVLFSWPIGPTTPDGSVPGTVPPGDNIARTRVMLTADPTRKAPMTHGLLNNSSVAQAQDRERPELTRWLFCGQGIHAERGECPTSAMHIGPGHETSGKLDGSREESLSSHPLSALLGETPLVISAHSPSSECVPSAPTYTFQSLPIIPAHPIPTSEGHDGAAPSREGEHPCLGPITITPAWGHSVHSQARLRTVHLSALPTAGWHYSIVFLLPYSVLCGAVLPGVGSHFTHGRELY